jgi:hypothetical protein
MSDVIGLLVFITVTMVGLVAVRTLVRKVQVWRGRTKVGSPPKGWPPPASLVDDLRRRLGELETKVCGLAADLSTLQNLENERLKDSREHGRAGASSGFPWEQAHGEGGQGMPTTHVPNSVQPDALLRGSEGARASAPRFRFKERGAAQPEHRDESSGVQQLLNDVCEARISWDEFVAKMSTIPVRTRWVDSKEMRATDKPTDLYAVFGDSSQASIVLADRVRYSPSFSMLFHRADAQSGQWVRCIAPCIAEITTDDRLEPRELGRLAIAE